MAGEDISSYPLLEIEASAGFASSTAGIAWTAEEEGVKQGLFALIDFWSITWDRVLRWQRVRREQEPTTEILVRFPRNVWDELLSEYFGGIKSTQIRDKTRRLEAAGYVTRRELSPNSHYVDLFPPSLAFDREDIEKARTAKEAVWPRPLMDLVLKMSLGLDSADAKRSKIEDLEEEGVVNRVNRDVEILDKDALFRKLPPPEQWVGLRKLRSHEEVREELDVDLAEFTRWLWGAEDIKDE